MKWAIIKLPRAPFNCGITLLWREAFKDLAAALGIIIGPLNLSLAGVLKLNDDFIGKKKHAIETHSPILHTSLEGDNVEWVYLLETLLLAWRLKLFLPHLLLSIIPSLRHHWRKLQGERKHHHTWCGQWLLVLTLNLPGPRGMASRRLQNQMAAICKVSLTP